MADYVNTARRSIFGPGNIDFMKQRGVAYAISGVLIVVGIVATVMRGSQILDIDFNGGTSIVFSLDKGVAADDVREIVGKSFETDENGLPVQLTLINVEVASAPKNSVYKLDVSLKDQTDVSRRLLEAFSKTDAARLVTYDLNYDVVNAQSMMGRNSQIRLVSFQDAPAATTPEEATATEERPAPAVASEGASSVPGKTTVNIALHTSVEGSGSAKMNAQQLKEALIKAAADVGSVLLEPQIDLFTKGIENWTPESTIPTSDWAVTLPFDVPTTTKIIEKFREQVRSQPVLQSISEIQGSVAREMQQRAWAGLFLSMIFIAAYIWFRFQRLAFGLATILALVHDVLITLCFVAISHWLFKPLGFLLIEDFKISLTIVAAFLTVIGYSLNDKIVVFDRIREVKGKSPRLTRDMINTSITQTLSRTLLTSSTTIIAILLMYFFGGEGIHGFAYCLFIGIVVGTYSSIYIATPLLLWLLEREQNSKGRVVRKSAA